MRLTRRTAQAGMMLLEALIGLLLFSIGILAMVAMQTTAVGSAANARFRTDAVSYADDLLGEIQLGVDRTSSATLATSLLAYQHQPSGSACDFSGAPATNADVLDWAANIIGTTLGTRHPLPGATPAMQQVLVDTSAAGHNQVTITLCWQAPKDPVPRKHIVVSYVN